jgi:hypothetical protein
MKGLMSAVGAMSNRNAPKDSADGVTGQLLRSLIDQADNQECPTDSDFPKLHYLPQQLPEP